MIYVRDDDVTVRAIWKHLLFLRYRIIVDIGISTSMKVPYRWIKNHLYMYEVCNHTHSHSPNFVNWDRERQSEDIKKAQEIIIKKLGVKPKYFIPPYGKYNENLLEVLSELGLQIHPSYLLRKINPDRYYIMNKEDIIGKKEGWYICHTSWRSNPFWRLKKNLRYLYENRLTRFW